MNENQLIDSTQKPVAKRAVIILTLIYGILFFPLLQITAFIGLVPNGHINQGIGYTIMMLIMFSIPLSILISICLMWVNFCLGHYKKAVMRGVLPIITILLGIIAVFLVLI